METLHGRVLCDLADAAMGVVYRSTLAEGETFTTIELRINFLRPVWNAKLRAQARIVRGGKVVGLVEYDLLDERQRLVARASSTCMTLRRGLAEGRQVTRDHLGRLRFGQPIKSARVRVNRASPKSYPSRLMPTNDWLDTFVGFICPGPNHREHVISQFSSAFRTDRRAYVVILRPETSGSKV